MSHSRRYCAGAGLVATLTGMAAGHLIAGLVNPAASPVLAVGSAVIDATPTPIKEWAVAQFGTLDKPLLLGSVSGVTLGLAALAGLAARRRMAFGAALLATLAGLATLAAIVRPTSTPIDALPGLVTGAVGLAILFWALRPPTPDAPTTEAKTALNRRSVLVLGLLTVAAAGAGQALVRAATKVASVALPKPMATLPPLPIGLEQTYPGITPLRTPTADFYRVDTRLVVPSVSPDKWRLVLDGDVPNERSWTFAELTAMDAVERDITMTCVSNEVGGRYVGAARWLGVPLTTLLAEAGIGSLEDTGADQILSTDVDGFTISTPLAVAMDGREPLVAFGMNGEPLPAEHGFPVRLVTPGIYGFVGSTKWLTKLTLTTYAADEAYWTRRGWATDAPIKIASRVDTPKPLASLEAGPTVIGGVAWAQSVGIASVEVRVDDGEWQRAELGPEVGIQYWRQWYLPWEATSGRHDLSVRATDRDGNVQIEDRAAPYPSGSSGYQSIAVTVK